jgi:hypothetical protein
MPEKWLYFLQRFVGLWEFRKQSNQNNLHWGRGDKVQALSDPSCPGHVRLYPNHPFIFTHSWSFLLRGWWTTAPKSKCPTLTFSMWSTIPTNRPVSLGLSSSHNQFSGPTLIPEVVTCLASGERRRLEVGDISAVVLLSPNKKLNGKISLQMNPHHSTREQTRKCRAPSAASACCTDCKSPIRNYIFLFIFYFYFLFICAYNVWVISPPSPHHLPYDPPCPLPLPPPPWYLAETILPLSLILLKRV